MKERWISAVPRLIHTMSHWTVRGADDVIPFLKFSITNKKDISGGLLHLAHLAKCRIIQYLRGVDVIFLDIVPKKDRVRIMENGNAAARAALFVRVVTGKYFRPTAAGKNILV